MHKTLRTLYFSLTLPALFATLALLGLERKGTPFILGQASEGLVLIFVLIAIASSLFIPVWLRIQFAGKTGFDGRISARDFKRYQILLQSIMAITLYTLPVAHAFQAPVTQLNFLGLLALFAVIYSYPSDRRIGVDAAALQLDEPV